MMTLELALARRLMGTRTHLCDTAEANAREGSGVLDFTPRQVKEASRFDCSHQGDGLKTAVRREPAGVVWGKTLRKGF